MRRWSIPIIAALLLLSGQTVLAAQPTQGVVRDLADANNARCHNPEGITASPNGLLYAAGLSGNICIYDLSGNELGHLDRKSTRLNSSHVEISYAVFCLKKKKNYK